MSALERWIFCTDIHGDKQDASANDAMFQFLSEWNPKHRICGGDVWDFRPLRRKANEDEKRESMAADFNAGVTWLKRFKPTFYLRGNHCERLWDLALLDRGVISDYAMTGTREIEKLMESMNCPMLPYNKRSVYRLGKLKAIHGFHAGVFAARQAALIYGSVLAGHSHAIDMHTIPALDQRTAWIVGCLCDLNMEYARANATTLRHEHGWAFGVSNPKTGFFQVWQARKLGGKWILPTGFREL